MRIHKRLIEIKADDRVLRDVAARGRTEITDIYHVDRGYERIDEKLRGLGAGVERV